MHIILYLCNVSGMLIARFIVPFHLEFGISLWQFLTFFLFLENHKDSEKYLGVRLLSILNNWARRVCKKSIEIEIQSGLLLVWSLHVINVSI